MRCHAPFYSINRMPDGYQVCCMHVQPRVDVPLEEWWNGEEMKETRRGLLGTGPLPDICKTCLKHETKDRAHLSQQYKTDNTYFAEEMPLVPEFANLVLSNKCNLACRTCSPYLSDTQANLRRKASIISSDERFRRVPAEELQKIEAIDTINRVSLTGGETQLDPIFTEFLRRYNKDIDLSITTNGHYYNVDFLEAANQYKHTDISFSLDGDKEFSQYMRTFSDSDLVYENMIKVLNDYPDMQVHFCYTVSNVSCWRIGEFVTEAFHKLRKDIHRIYGGFNIVSFPLRHHIAVLPDHKKVELRAKLEEDRNTINNIKKKSKGDCDLINGFLWDLDYIIEHCINIDIPNKEQYWDENVNVHRLYDKHLNIKNSIIKTIMK